MGRETPQRRLRIAVIANTSWYLYNFRRSLIARLHGDGHHVAAIGSSDEYVDRLRHDGIRSVGVPFSASGLSPWRELQTVRALRRALQDERVDVALTYTPKGTIYTALALTGSRTPIIANISGLGRGFIRGGWLAKAVQLLYRIALRRASVVFFQNEEDQRIFLRSRLVEASRARRVPGSGIDLQRFQPRPVRPADGSLRVLMIARLLWSKGVREYVEAARSLRSEGDHWRFALLGPMDEPSDSAVPRPLLEQWVSQGWIEYLGSTDDVRPYLQEADCVVLPSYREGVPRSLLEAAAMARPVIATDAPGCRDCVNDGVTGFLCQARDANDLASALRRFASLSDEARARMGMEGRRKMEGHFDEGLVIEAYRQALAELEERESPQSAG